MKLVKSGVTPEQYHLDHGPKLRDQLGEQIKAQCTKLEAEYGKAISADLKRMGVKSIENQGYQFKAEHGRLKLRIEIKNSSEIKGEIKERLKINPEYLQRRKRELCKILDPSGAKKFGVFVRTKYGKAASQQLIAQAHDEWLDLLSNCEC